jgi:hypothetical protein
MHAELAAVPSSLYKIARANRVIANVRHSETLPLDTYSIQLRLQRTTTEHCFVSVPVTSDIIDQQADGTGRVNFERMTAAAIQIATLQDVQWHTEDSVIQPHPIQRPKEEGE